VNQPAKILSWQAFSIQKCLFQRSLNALNWFSMLQAEMKMFRLSKKSQCRLQLTSFLQRKRVYSFDIGYLELPDKDNATWR